MTKLLVIEASPQGEDSISRNLAKTFVEQWKTAHPGGEVVERDLVKIDLPYMSLPWDIATQYLRLILQVIGIEDVTFVAAGGTRSIYLGEKTRAEFLQPFEPAVTSAAQS